MSVCLSEGRLLGCPKVRGDFSADGLTDRREAIFLEYVFFVPGRPVGKARPKFGGGKVYTPERTKAYEGLVRQAFLAEYREAVCEGEKAVFVHIWAYFAPPVRLSEAKKEALCGVDYAKKPDIDNIAKAILDALNGLVYADDRQVTEIYAKKSYAPLEGGEGVLVKVEML